MFGGVIVRGNAQRQYWEGIVLGKCSENNGRIFLAGGGMSKGKRQRELFKKNVRGKVRWGKCPDPYAGLQVYM